MDKTDRDVPVDDEVRGCAGPRMLGPMDFDDFMARHELRDPQALLEEIASAVPLTEGRVLLALVHQPARGQKLLALDELTPLPVGIDEGHRGRSDLLCDRVWRLPIPPRSDTSASILVTVIVRSGTNGWGEEEMRWAMGWRYSNHNSDAFDRDLIVVTPHGWCSLWSESGGHTPAMAPS